MFIDKSHIIRKPAVFYSLNFLKLKGLFWVLWYLDFGLLCVCIIPLTNVEILNKCLENVYFACSGSGRGGEFCKCDLVCSGFNWFCLE